MGIIKKAMGKLMETRPGATSNRTDVSRRKVDDRRMLCDLEKYKSGVERNGKDRRQQQERRKRWKRVSKWCSEKNNKSYLEGYHVE